jgi:glycosyltransferase involved in cell wall biosynthesis
MDQHSPPWFSDVRKIKTQAARRMRQVPHLLRTEGFRPVVDRLRRVGAHWLAPSTQVPLVRTADVVAADLSHPYQPLVPAWHSGGALVANWIITPPAPRSGGHTTLFRVLRYLEAHGYRNHVYFYNASGSDHQYFKDVVRNDYGFHGPVTDVAEGMEDAHFVIATGWPTAYPAFNSRCAGKRFYFIQDFEPDFYPAGSTRTLAENTYRMGFNGISIGHAFAQRLADQFGMHVDTFEYGCDTSVYFRIPARQRSGVVFYARREAARRGLDLGLMALQLFAERHPSIPIHIYGDSLGRLPFQCVDHGSLDCRQINELFNSCHAGLSLSFTNVSLVALEMLAAGCIPVVNDTVSVRADLDNPLVSYARADPASICAALEQVISTHDFSSVSAAAASSVQGTTWEQACAVFDCILRRSMNIQDSPQVDGHKGDARMTFNT